MKNTKRNTTNLIVVSIDLVYIAETSPSHSPPGKDRQVKVTYVYCRELDDKNNMIGGEWLNNKHPNFVWTPADNANADNDEDLQAASIQGDISSPEVLKQLTKLAILGFV